MARCDAHPADQKRGKPGNREVRCKTVHNARDPRLDVSRPARLPAGIRIVPFDIGQKRCRFHARRAWRSGSRSGQAILAG